MALSILWSSSLFCIVRLSFCESKIIDGASCPTPENSLTQLPLTEFVSTCSRLLLVELELGPEFHTWSIVVDSFHEGRLHYADTSLHGSDGPFTLVNLEASREILSFQALYMAGSYEAWEMCLG